ncbi:MAG: serine/threonine protein phosphatase, partial [Rhodothermaceae bacterium]
MGYLHVEVEGRQLSKKAGKVCGDVFIHYRDKSSTIVILSDGLGSGIKANIAATMCVTRLKELIKSGYSVRHAFTNLVETMENARK